MTKRFIDWEIQDEQYTRVFLKLCRETGWLEIRGEYVYFSIDYEFRMKLSRYMDIMKGE